MSSSLAFRGLTLFAAAFFALDGVALIGLGVWGGRRGLIVGGSLLLLSAVLILLLWRRHLRRLDEIDQARRELREEAEDLRRVLRG